MPRRIKIDKTSKDQLAEVLKLGFKIVKDQGQEYLEIPPEGGIGISAKISKTKVGENFDLKYNNTIVCTIRYSDDEIDSITTKPYKNNLIEALRTFEIYRDQKLEITVPNNDLGGFLADVNNSCQSANPSFAAGQITAGGALRSLNDDLCSISIADSKADSKENTQLVVPNKNKAIEFMPFGSRPGIFVSREPDSKGDSKNDSKESRIEFSAAPPITRLAIAAYQAKKELKRDGERPSSNLFVDEKLEQKQGAHLEGTEISLDDKANLLAGYASEYQDKYNKNNEEKIKSMSSN